MSDFKKMKKVELVEELIAAKKQEIVLRKKADSASEKDELYRKVIKQLRQTQEAIRTYGAMRFPTVILTAGEKRDMYDYGETYVHNNVTDKQEKPSQEEVLRTELQRVRSEREAEECRFVSHIWRLLKD